MTVRPTSNPATVPLVVLALAAIVVATGWLVVEGMPFIVGVAITCALVVVAIGVLTAHLDDA